MSQALYRKWRPNTWEKVIGQDHVTQTLQNAVQSDRVGHAYLFAGPRGTGKTSTARLLAKSINCLAEDPAKRPCNECTNCTSVNEGRFLDLIEIDAASNTSVDDVRDLRDKINFSPSQGKYKVYIIDEVHMLSTAAFNALLKTLEEPPTHAIFILATTEIHKIPATVLSRCQRHEFRRISVNDIVKQIEEIIEHENIIVEPDALVLIARQSTGAMRDAISLLDQLASTGEPVTLAVTHNVLGTATNQAVVDLVGAILEHKADSGLNTIHKALDSGTDARQLARQVVDYLRNLLLIKLGNEDRVDVTTEMQKQMEKHSKGFEPDQLLRTINLFNNAASETQTSWQPSLPLELSLAESADPNFARMNSDSIPEPNETKNRLTTPTHKIPVKTNQKKPIVTLKQLAENPPDEQSGIRSTTSIHVEKTAPSKEVFRSEDELASREKDSSTGEISINKLKQNWDEIRRQVKISRPSTEGLLNSCKSISIKNGELVLGFASNIVKSKMQNKENMNLACQIISKIMGVDIKIQCVVVNRNLKSSPTTGDIVSDGMVNTALNLGGQIVQKE
ncbi:MAG: DNA polymerase III subunit gamma/tau [Anaerolineaceae bacterium]|nr:DNA polymerase III subunit gamma/tau [Anaerolineaceae bacterium]